MTIGFHVRGYLKQTPGPAVFVDVLRALALLASPFLAWLFLRWTAKTDVLLAPIHRRLWANPSYAGAQIIYLAFITLAVAGNLAWILRAVRNFIVITVSRSARPKREQVHEHLSLPPWPFTRERFAVTIGELQDRDGSRVPNQTSPHAKPRWLILPELSLYTGVFVTGGIGSGKTSAVAYPALRQLLGFLRYCPTFLMADEAQQSATSKDAEFKAVCRSKRASMWELTQSHGSIKGAFGPYNQAHAATYFQNSMTTHPPSPDGRSSPDGR